MPLWVSEKFKNAWVAFHNFNHFQNMLESEILSTVQKEERGISTH